MGDFWFTMIEAVRFGFEAQTVITARLLLFASGAPDAADEAALMVAEKIVAFAESGRAAEQALADGSGFAVAAVRAYAPLRDCVHANSGRLTGALH